MSYRFFKNSSRDFYDYTMDRILKYTDKKSRSKEDFNYVAQIISGDSLGGDTTTPQQEIRYVNLNGKVAMAFKIRFVEKSSKYNFVENPFPVGENAETITEEEKKVLVSMHDDAFLEANEIPVIPKFGDKVVCKKLPGRIFIIEKVLTNESIIGQLAESGALSDLQYATGGPSLGSLANNSPIDYSNVEIKPISTARGSLGDPRFSKGRCPKSGTNKYQSVIRKETTWFYEYEEAAVVAAMKKSGEPLYVQLTMFCFMGIEQPKYKLPNNNPAGIQTDGGGFKGTEPSDFDYQTCYRDKSMYRSFGGFNTLVKAMKTYGKIIRNKYQNAPLWVKSNKDTPLEEAATNLANCYYTGWVFITNERQLKRLQRGLPIKMNGKMIDKNYKWTRNLFKSRVKRFLTM